MAEVAPDTSSMKAALKLAAPHSWTDVGVHDALLWGLCQGSGKKPYQVSVDTSGPAYKCSCPSRKFPCKHALALLMLWSQGHIADSDAIAEFAQEWARGRAERAEKAAAKAANAASGGEKSAASVAASDKRAAQREEWVGAGLNDLDRFLIDQIREGLASNSADRAENLRRMAARMVDAQAPGVAGRLRKLASTVSTVADWPTVVTHEYGRLHLLAQAWAGRDKLPADLLATVRAHIGFPMPNEQVMESPAVRDQWVILGSEESKEQQLTTRRTWLLGQNTGRWALVLHFAHAGAALPTDLPTANTLDADLHFYPGALPLRAIVGTRYSDLTPTSGWDFRGVDIDTARAEYATALGADPWLERWPMALHGMLTYANGGVYMNCGQCVRLSDGAERILARAGTSPLTIFGTPQTIIEPQRTIHIHALSFLSDGQVFSK